MKSIETGHLEIGRPTRPPRRELGQRSPLMIDSRPSGGRRTPLSATQRALMGTIGRPVV